MQATLVSKKGGPAFSFGVLHLLSGIPIVTTSIGKKQSISPHEKRLALLSRCLQDIRDASQPEDLFPIVIAYLQQEFPYPLIWLGQYDRSQNSIQGAGGTAPAQNNSALQGSISLTPGELMEQVVSQLRPMMVPDLRAEQRGGRLLPLAQKLGIQGALLFPLRYRDQCYGVLFLGSDRWGMLAKTDEKAILSIVTGEVGAALHRFAKIGRAHV